MKFRLASAKYAIEDAWRLIDHMDPEKARDLIGKATGIDYMLKRLKSGYQHAKKELQHDSQ